MSVGTEQEAAVDPLITDARRRYQEVNRKIVKEEGATPELIEELIDAYGSYVEARTQKISRPTRLERWLQRRLSPKQAS